MFPDMVKGYETRAACRPHLGFQPPDIGDGVGAPGWIKLEGDADRPCAERAQKNPLTPKK